MPDFIENYLEYTSGNEAHENHHLWCALVVLSSVISRRVHINMGYFRVYANLFTVLVAPPGGRKTTAMSVARKMLDEIKGIPFSADCTTKEAIVKAIKGTEVSFSVPLAAGVIPPPLVMSPLTICVTEMSEFLSASQENMVNFLTAIYDQDKYTGDTVHRGRVEILGPYLVLLGCTTAEWIAARLRDDVLSGGFSSRAVFVYEWERKRIPRPVITPQMQTAWANAVAHCLSLKKVGGEMRWSKEAEQWYDAWYMSYEIPKHLMLKGYYDRKHLHLLKVATLCALSEGCGLVLDPKHLIRALAILDRTELNMPRVFEGVGRNELNAIASRVLDLLKQHGGALPEKEVYSVMFSEGNENEIRQVVQHLEASDKIAVCQVPKGKRFVKGLCLYDQKYRFQQGK